MDILNIICLRVDCDDIPRGVYELAKDKRGYFWGLLLKEANSIDMNNKGYPRIQREYKVERGGYLTHFDFDEAEYLEAMKKCGDNSNS